MASILEYMKNTPPETAWNANGESGRNTIVKEANEFCLFLKRVRETAEKIACFDTIQEINKDILFVCKWMMEFNAESKVKESEKTM